MPAELLRPSRFTTEEAKIAAVSLRLVQGGCQQCEMLEMVDACVKVVGTSTYAMNRLLNTLASGRVAEADGKAFLVEMLRALPEQSWAPAQMAFGALTNILRRRTSGLEDQTAWSHLGLPPV